MLEIRRDANLGEEPIGPELRAELGVEHLERDASVVAQVAREVDRRHSAGADLALDLVAPREGRIQLTDRFHRGAVIHHWWRRRRCECTSAQGARRRANSEGSS